VRLEDKALIATFKKDRWASYKRSEKTGHRNNKKRSYLGTLQIYPEAYSVQSITTRPTTNEVAAVEANPIIMDLASGQLDEKQRKKTRRKLPINMRNVKMDGAHSGHLTEEAIAYTCWMAVEAEHRIRYKIFDLLEEIGESLGG
jgi:hypothetical protein